MARSPRVAEFYKLQKRLQDIDRQLTLIDKEEEAKKTGGGPLVPPQRIEKIRRDRVRLVSDRKAVKSKLDMLKKAPVPSKGAPSTTRPGAPSTTTPGTSSTTRPGTPSPGTTSGATEKKYDTNIGIDEQGNVSVVGSLTPAQVAIMFPAAFGAATPSQVKDAAEGPSRPTSPPPGKRPPEDYRPINYKDRERFESHVFQQIGFNPIIFDPYEYVNRAMSQLPRLFNHVFRGKIMWADRNKLNKKELAHWQSVVKMYRANKFEEAKAKQAEGMNQYNWMMNKFDYIAKRKEQRLKEYRSPPKTKELWSEKAGAMTLHNWDPNTRTWVDTGQVSKAPKPGKGGMPQEVKDAWNIVRTLAKTYGGEDIGNEPTGPDDAMSKFEMLYGLIGDAVQKDDRLKKLYENQLNVLMKYFGISESAPDTAVTPGTEGGSQTTETKTYKSKDGKTYTVKIIK